MQSASEPQTWGDKALFSISKRLFSDINVIPTLEFYSETSRDNKSAFLCCGDVCFCGSPASGMFNTCSPMAADPPSSHLLDQFA